MQRGDPNCPVQPIPVALPNPLPSGIQDALSKLESLMQSTLNNDTLVRYSTDTRRHSMHLCGCVETIALMYAPGAPTTMYHSNTELSSIYDSTCTISLCMICATATYIYI